ncbi:hypothetical protein G9A89_002433 [Geosiphon pyriformis]|nr:hypothetical protein G9A89_002433 [Geosiphon pyriformis]
MGACLGKWNNTPCLACGETLFDEGMWNDIPERGGMCDVFCQYTILISDWIEKGTPIEAKKNQSAAVHWSRNHHSIPIQTPTMMTTRITVQNGNNSNSDSNPNSNHEQYIVLPDLSKEQELKWFSHNSESIMPEHTHDMDAEFDLRYPGKDAIKLEPNA